MGKCRNCNVEILDETDHCPLCRSILEPTHDVENMYPNVALKTRLLMLFSRVYLFGAILVVFLLVGINIVTPSQMWWSVLVGLVLLYGYLVLRYAVLGKTGYRSKILVLVLIGLLSLVAADFVTGYRGWSVNYVLPGSILLVDAIILGCMVWNRRNWQSYMMWQLLMILCSLVPAVLALLEIEQGWHLAFLPLVASCALFLWTLIIGDRRARLELKRRFHIH